MATDAEARGPESLIDSLRRSITCVACGDDSKELRMLTCQHLICNDCLRDLFDAPECKSPPECTKCSEPLIGKPDQYPVCKLVEHFRKKVKLLEETLELDCQNRCQAPNCGKLPLVVVCRQCKKFLCFQCRSSPCLADDDRHETSDIKDCVVESKETFNLWKIAKQKSVQALNVKKEEITEEIKVKAQNILDATPETISDLTATLIPSLTNDQKELLKTEISITDENASLFFAESKFDGASDLELIRLVEQLNVYERAREVALGDYEPILTGVQGYDVVLFPAAKSILVATTNGVSIYNKNDMKFVRSIEFPQHPFSIVPYKDEVVIASHSSSMKLEMLALDSTFNVVRKWSTPTPIPCCDIAVVDDRVFMSTIGLKNIQVYSISGEHLPSLIWNGKSVGVTAIPPSSLILADEDYHKVYKKRITSQGHGGAITWRADVKAPFSVCAAENGSVWIRSNKNDCFTVLSRHGETIQEIMDDRITKLGEITGILHHEDHLYVCHEDGMGRFNLSLK